MILLLLATAVAYWNPNQTPEPDRGGYRLYQGTNSGSYYTNYVTTNTHLVITNVVFGPNYFVLTAFSSDGLVESQPSEEVVYVYSENTVAVFLEEACNLDGPWETISTNIMVVPNNGTNKFYRSRLEISK